MYKQSTKKIFSVAKNCNYEITVKSKNINNFKIFIKEDKEFGNIVVKKKREHRFCYYNWNLNKITLIIRSSSKCNVLIKKKNIAIKQIYVSTRYGYFKEELMKTYNLKEYHNHYLPAIFFGIFSREDIDALKKNKSLKIIVWAGSDIYFSHENKKYANLVINNIKKIRKMSRIKHIAISKFIVNDLKKLKIPFIHIPFSAINVDMLRPVFKGRSMYIYTSPFDPEKYGEDIYPKIIKKYPNINFIITCTKNDYENMKSGNIKKKSKYEMKYYDKKILVNEIYPKCFLGLRLTKHDGLAGSVIELGAMGIKSIHNGSSPSCLNYQSLDDIYKHIDNEIKKIGTCDHQLSKKVKKYLKLHPKFFSTAYFKNK